ncbi:MAG: methylated-DNA--[protein]-cysteine S-methyltransferase [bacterium]|nr:methylated-DNA--[protein]-cysteine S-methyltransferase [bacterium]
MVISTIPAQKHSSCYVARKKTKNIIYYTAISSTIGKLYLAATERGLARIRIGKNNDKSLFLKELYALYPSCSIEENSVPFRKIIQLLNQYFSGKKINISRLSFDFSLGTPLQQSIWKILCQIPYGQLRSYQWIAEQINNPNAARAVGQATGKNPIPILVPCHRVINKNGTLGGYSGGINIKRKLLEIEGISLNAKCQNLNGK